jgi:hypothetical protein
MLLLMLMVLTRDLREAFEDPMLGVADARNAGAVGEAQLRHLAAGLETRRWRIFSGIFFRKKHCPSTERPNAVLF